MAHLLMLLNWRASRIENLSSPCICSASRSVSLFKEDLLVIFHKILSLTHLLTIVDCFSN